MLEDHILAEARLVLAIRRNIKRIHQFERMNAPGIVIDIARAALQENVKRLRELSGTLNSELQTAA